MACRLHAVLCELVPGGVSKQIYAAAAARILDQIEPAGRRFGSQPIGPLNATNNTAAHPETIRRLRAQESVSATITDRSDF